LELNFRTPGARLIEALAAIYPETVFDDPRTWPRARRLDALLTALIDFLEEPCAGEEKVASYLLNRLASYKQRPLAAYGEAQPLFERGLAICEKAFGPDHPDTATSLNDLAFLLQERGDLAGARPLLERASAICDKTLGADHPDTARNLTNLGSLLRMQGDFVGAQKNYDRALAIFNKAYGPRHPDTASGLCHLGALLEAQDRSESAQTYYEQAQAIYEKTSPDHPDTATNLSNLGRLLQKRGDLEGARSYYERALSIREHALGTNHPDRARSLNDLGLVSNMQGNHAVAWACYKRALEILGGLGIMHSLTQTIARNAYETLGRLKLDEEAAALSKKYALRIKESRPTRPKRR
jgi:tetratricopeptide (TPR) repeat protein